MEAMDETTAAPVAVEAKKEKKVRGKGVVYLSRVPPYMKPAKVKHLLEQFGTVTRLYLAPEDSSVAKRRKKLGTNKAKNFTEGWIEFADRGIAKMCAASLNATPLSNNKRDYYGEDLWNLKYLKGFKWEHLTEKMAYERRVREAVQRVAVSATRRDNQEFLDRVEQREASARHRTRKPKVAKIAE
ncbi:hypothetical protein M885DRAFT_510478 [Pelagophyceae sp. CCMP2097]|nr:hypothetical protein M885DRAFT_510478 [Pelagophyceae sp. CCMP2097]